MDVKQKASGEAAEPTSMRQRHIKGHEHHIKKHATPSQARANREQQQKLATKVANGTDNRAGPAPNRTNNEKYEGPIGGASSGTKDQKKLGSDRARVEKAGSNLDKNLEIYSKKAKEIKAQIEIALEKQTTFHDTEQLDRVDELRENILKLTRQRQQKVESDINGGGLVDEQQVLGAASGKQQQLSNHPNNDCAGSQSTNESGRVLLNDNPPPDDKLPVVGMADSGKSDEPKTSEPIAGPEKAALDSGDIGAQLSTPTQEAQTVALEEKDDLKANASMPTPTPKTHKQVTFKSNKESNQPNSSSNGNVIVDSATAVVVPLAADCRGDKNSAALSNNCFEPLTARLDPKSKIIALKSSLEKHFVACPELLDPICQQFIMLTKQIHSLTLNNERNQMEIEKLTAIKGKLSDLCRELQRSNNQIRIESLDMIKAEQHKAKEQAGKIQSTLSGVMKLFDENQQRNLILKQENIELQGKLKSILEHCDNWEKCVDTALKQRELENRLIKTEMAKLKLMHSEEKETFFKEKQGLLRALTTMKAQQSKIEEKETKLRSDLTNYASKYDECQEIIHNGLSKFQLESKRMLKQVEQSRQDYIQLLGKYEASNKKIKQLLEEKQTWAKSLGAANKKVETLERLCRTLKAENDRLLRQQQQQDNKTVDDQLVD